MPSANPTRNRWSQFSEKSEQQHKNIYRDDHARQRNSFWSRLSVHKFHLPSGSQNFTLSYDPPSDPTQGAYIKKVVWYRCCPQCYRAVLSNTGFFTKRTSIHDWNSTHITRQWTQLLSSCRVSSALPLVVLSLLSFDENGIGEDNLDDMYMDPEASPRPDRPLTRSHLNWKKVGHHEEIISKSNEGESGSLSFVNCLPSCHGSWVWQSCQSNPFRPSCSFTVNFAE